MVGQCQTGSLGKQKEMCLNIWKFDIAIFKSLNLEIKKIRNKLDKTEIKFSFNTFIILDDPIHYWNSGCQAARYKL